MHVLTARLRACMATIVLALSCLAHLGVGRRVRSLKGDFQDGLLPSRQDVVRMETHGQNKPLFALASQLWSQIRLTDTRNRRLALSSNLPRAYQNIKSTRLATKLNHLASSDTNGNTDGDINDLMFTLALPGDQKGAEELLRRILIRLHDLRDEYPEGIRTLHTTNWSLSGILKLEVLRAMIRSLGTEDSVMDLRTSQDYWVDWHPEALTTMNDAAEAMEHRDMMKGASTLRWESFNFAAKRFGILHPLTLKARNLLLRSLFCLLDLDSIVGLQKVVWEARVKTLGKTHHETLASRDVLIKAMIAHGYKEADALDLVRQWETFILEWWMEYGVQPRAVTMKDYSVTWTDRPAPRDVGGEKQYGFFDILERDVYSFPAPFTLIRKGVVSSKRKGMLPVVIFPGYGLNADDYKNMFQHGTPLYEMDLWDSEGLSYKPGSEEYNLWWIRKLAEVNKNISEFGLSERTIFFAHSVGARFAVAASAHHQISALVTYGRSPQCMDLRGCRAKRVLCLIGDDDSFANVSRGNVFQRSAYLTWTRLVATQNIMPYFGLVRNGGHFGIISKEAKERLNNNRISMGKSPSKEKSRDVRALVGRVA